MTIQLIALKDLVAGNKVSFFGKRPAENIGWIKSSIRNEGLLNPLIVTRHKNRFIVLDGKKRLAAIRQLAKSRNPMRALNKIPCRVDVPNMNTQPAEQPVLMSEPELAHKIIAAAGEGTSPRTLSRRFDCAISVVKDALTLPGLHPTLLMHFNNKTITLRQASALATIANPKAQLTLLMQLGPFVSRAEIIDSIKSGAAVLDLPNGEILIMPSRKAPVRTPYFDRMTTVQEHDRIAA